jgi:glutamate dehydrogenase/leucine dehydrogenase
MQLMRLKTVDAFIAFDLDDCKVNAGGTRLAPDVTEREVTLLARAMTYKFAVLHQRIGGAKAAVRGSDAERGELLRRYCEEIRPLAESARFVTGPDLGTFESDFAPLRAQAPVPGAIDQEMDGVPFEDVLTGFGVVVAAEAALGSLEKRSVVVEGFGKVGGGVAREAVRRGGRVIAVSTIAGCVVSPLGFDVDELWRLRARHGDDFVRHAGIEVLPPSALFDVEADVLVPGARPGVIDLERAGHLRVRAIVPAANVPYAAGTIKILRERGVLALADFICNAGAVMGYLSPAASSHEEVLESVERKIRELVAAASSHPRGPFAGASALAEEFLGTWRDTSGMPRAPALA